MYSRFSIGRASQSRRHGEHEQSQNTAKLRCLHNPLFRVTISKVPKGTYFYSIRVCIVPGTVGMEGILRKVITCVHTATGQTVVRLGGSQCQ